MPMGFTTEEFLGGKEAVDAITAQRSGESWLDKIVNGVKTVLPGAISAAKGALAQLSYSGSTGNFQTAFEPITLSAKFQWLVDQSPARLGSPLYREVYLKDLTGFVKCENPVFQSSIATAVEEEAIESFMAAGFFME